MSDSTAVAGVDLCDLDQSLEGCEFLFGIFEQSEGFVPLTTMFLVESGIVCCRGIYSVGEYTVLVHRGLEWCHVRT